MAVAGSAGIRGRHSLRHPAVAGAARDVADDGRRNLRVRDEVTLPLKRLQQEHYSNMRCRLTRAFFGKSHLEEVGGIDVVQFLRLGEP